MSIEQAEFQGYPDQAPAEQAPRPGYTKTAWIVVAALVLLSIFLHGREGEDQGSESLSAFQQNVLDLQGQYLVAAAQTPGIQEEQLFDSAKALDTGPPSMRLRFVVLAGELAGPDEALEKAIAVEQTIAEQKTVGSERERRVARLLGILYADYRDGRWDGSCLEHSDRQLLKDELGWYGELALAPAPPETDGDAAGDGGAADMDRARQKALAPAWRTFIVLILTFLLLLGLGIAGLAGAITFLILVATRKVRSAIETGCGNSGIYAETFAVWMLLFFALSVGASLVARSLPDSEVLISCVASALSMGALIWPVIRGVSWSHVRRDIGLSSRGKPIRELFWGVVCYVSNLPILVLGVLTTAALLSIYNAITGGSGGLDSPEAPSHPAFEWAQGAGWSGRLQIFLLACLVAPIIEEIVFRGVLYRHLRESTRLWRLGTSIACSIGLTSLIFAVIHPQGLFAVPALMAVATGLSLAREWRGSLLAPMAMHATNNGLLMLVLFSMM